MSSPARYVQRNLSFKPSRRLGSQSFLEPFWPSQSSLPALGTPCFGDRRRQRDSDVSWHPPSADLVLGTSHRGVHWRHPAAL